ncbi:MAG: hypothetical protein ACK4RK_11820 [Gemmataceae bacterium]
MRIRQLLTITLGVGAWLAWLPLASAQQQFPIPVLSSVMPPGGKLGSTVEVTLTGNHLDEVTALYFSQPDIKAERIPDPPPPDNVKTPPPPGPVKFKVTIPANTPLGYHDVRVIGKWGISNPRVFAVDDLNEIMETEPNSDVPQAESVEINTIINGVIDNRVDVDYFTFTGRKGQKIIVHCAASSIDSRLTPQLELFDARDRLLAHNRNYRDRDAMMYAVLPADGDYYVRLSEYTYQNGSAEYFYRLSISERPWIDAAYPPVVEPGKPATLTLIGHNLPGGQPDASLRTANGAVLEKATVKITPPKGAMNEQLVYQDTALPHLGGLDGFEYRVQNAAGTSNAVLLTYAAAPLVLDNEKNLSPETAQRISVPGELCGRIERRRDRDWYVFSAKQGEVYRIEAYADRLGSPVDLSFMLRRVDNQQVIGEYVDHPDIPPRIGPLYTFTADPKARFVVPADGDYELLVQSNTSYSRAGPHFIYHLSIQPEQPDFRLLVVGNHELSATGLTLRQGGSQAIQVVCLRDGGFDGEVTLTVEGLPKGITCPPQTLGPKLRDTYVVLTAAANAPNWDGAIRIKGTASINGKPVTQEARTACLVWPIANVNIAAISRLSRSLCLAVREKGPFILQAKQTQFAVPLGGTLEVPLTIHRQMAEFKAPVQITRLSAPTQTNGIPLNIQAVTIAANQSSANVRLTVPANAQPGNFNLVLQGNGQFQFAKEPKGKPTNIRAIEYAPPIAVTVYNQVAELSTTTPKVTVAAGKEAALTVQLKRLHDYKGEFQVQLVLPSGFAGVSAAATKIAPNANDIKLTLKVAANAKPASNPNVIVRATARVGNVTFTHDLPMAVTITAGN